MSKIRSLSLVLAAALALVAGPASAASRAGAAPTQDPVVAESVLFELVWPGQTNAPAEDCRERTSNTGARAFICHAYARNGFGGAYGYYRGTLYGATFVQINVDGFVANLTTRPNFSGIFSGVGALYFRACNQSGCGSFS